MTEVQTSEAASGAWARLIQKGTAKSMENLSQMVGQEIETKTFRLREIPIAQISELVGGPEVMSVGIYLTVHGSADGHLMLIYDPGIACAFVDLLMMQPEGTTTTLGEMEQSALGEMGNIVGASFLNVLADDVGMDLRPSPPAVMLDMAGALLDLVAADLLMTQDDAFVAETTFSAPGREITGMFFVMPSASLMEKLIEWERAA
jgi:chemotaxis protein CheC